MKTSRTKCCLWRRRHKQHKERNLCDLLPERDRPAILAKIRGARSLTDPALAEQRLERLACELDRTWPDAAGSLREGLDDTLTLMRLGITGRLAKTLCSTNPCESMIEIVRYTQRNVKRWRDGGMRNWTAAGMLVAEQQFRRIIGYRDLAKLVIAIERYADRVKLADANTVTITHSGVRGRYCLTVNHMWRPPPSSTTIRTSFTAGIHPSVVSTACLGGIAARTQPDRDGAHLAARVQS